MNEHNCRACDEYEAMLAYEAERNRPCCWDGDIPLTADEALFVAGF